MLEIIFLKSKTNKIFLPNEFGTTI